MRAYVPLLRNRAVLRLLAGAVPARLGYAMVALAVFFRTEQVTGSVVTAGLAIGANTLAGSLTAGIRGSWIDRYGQTRPLLVLVPAYTVALAVLAYVSDPHLMVLLALVLGLAAPPINLSARPLWPLAVPPDQLRTAYALDSTSIHITMVVGPVLATSLALQVSGAAALLAVAACVLVGGMLLASSPLSRRWVPEARDPSETPLFRSAAMRLLAVEGALFGLGFGALEVAVPAIATLNDRPGAAATVLAALSVGSIVGGLAVGTVTTRVLPLRGWLVSNAVMAVVAPLLLLTAPGASMAVVAVALGLAMGPSQVFYWEVVDAVRPRGTSTSALGWLWSVEGVASAAGSSLAGWAAGALGATWALALVPAGIAASPVVVLLGRGRLAAAAVAPPGAEHEETEAPDGVPVVA